MSELFSFSFSAMGGAGNLHLYANSASAAEAAAERAIAEVERIERRYSHYRADSLLSAINRVAGAGGRLTVDGETAGLLDYAYACHAHSGGLFDISSGALRAAWDLTGDHIPSAEELAALLPRVGLDKTRWTSPHLQFDVSGMNLDFGGIGKEYAADRAASVCIDAGITGGLIELSGDIRVIGPHPDATPWAVAIVHPRTPERPCATVMIACGGLATSGDYARCIVVDGTRYSHLLDPGSGWPVQGLAAVSIHAERCMVAGSISTIAMFV